MTLIFAATPPFYVQVDGSKHNQSMPRINAPDLTQRPPRSPRVRLGGFVILPRLLDKGRATVAGIHGEFHYACPLDEHFFDFAGIDSGALKKQLATGKSDSEILAWIHSTSTTKPDFLKIAAWSAYQEQRVPSNLESRELLNDYHAKLAPHREDVTTWFDILDLDDFVTFGGKP